MATYEQSNFEQFAAAIGLDVGQIAKHENLFEAAALWYRLNSRRPTRVAPSNLRRKLDQFKTLADYLRPWGSIRLMRRPTVLAIPTFSMPSS